MWSDGGDSRLAWTTETEAGQPDDALHSHVFLGPPTLVGGMAYCLTENDDELFAVALDATNGDVLWKQPIALSEHSLLSDRQRSLRAGLPTVTRGLVLCPTNIGLLVAVDAVTGQLRWHHSSLEPSREPRPARFSAPLPPQHRRQSAFAPAVYASRDRVVYLPSQSDAIFCLELSSGRELWRSPQPDAEYLAGLADDRLIVVGRGSCRCLSLQTGETQWTAPLDSVPAGSGLLLADGVLLPLDSGRVLALDLERGRPMGFDFSENGRLMGHLVLASDVVLTMGGSGVAAYPQAGPALRQLTALDPSSRSDSSHWLGLADVYLVQGDLGRSVEALQAGLSGLMESESRHRAERTLREVYFRLLQEQPAQSAEWFERLAPLCRTNDQQARRLISLSGWHLQSGRKEAAVEAGAALSRLADVGLHAAPNQSGLEVSIPVWLATLKRTHAGDRLPRVDLAGTQRSQRRRESPSWHFVTALRHARPESILPVRIALQVAGMAPNCAG